MPINFPSSPVNGDQYTYSGLLWIYNSTVGAWKSSGAAPEGSNTQLQFNDSGFSNGSSNLTFNKTNNTLTVANAAFSGNVSFTANVNHNDAYILRALLQDYGYQYYNADNSAAIDYTNGSYQRMAITGTHTLTTSNWPPSGILGELMIEGVNLGAATLSMGNVNWIKTDGTTTNVFASSGYTLQTSGVNFIIMWTRDAGTTKYAKVV